MTTPTFDELLREAHYELFELTRRQYALEAFEEEHQRATLGKEYWVADDIVWTTILDMRDKNIIDFASWAVGAYKPGSRGFFGVLKGRYVPDLPLRRKWGRRDESSSAPEFDQTFSDAVQRLFPNAKGKLRHEDIDELTTRFQAKLKPLIDDRHQNRAHVFEGKHQVGSAKMLEIGEVRELYKFARDVLNDLGLMSLGKTWAEVNLTLVQPEDTAEEFVDMLVLPRWFRRAIAARGLSRGQAYEALHNAPGKGLFNDPHKLDALAYPEDAGLGATARSRVPTRTVWTPPR